MIITNNYIINKSQIFYLFEDNNQLATGILDMEELKEIKDAETTLQ